MRKPSVETDTSMRLVQIFLNSSPSDNPGVFEVSIKGNGDLHCTCPGYQGKASCKHTKFVRERVDDNGGTYPLEVSSRATPQESQEAQQSDETFRQFILKYGKIEVF